MNYLKYLIYFLILPAFVLYYGCESNDTPTSSVYIPQAVNKKVLVEFFTNAGCLPCVNAHHYLDQITSSSGATINDTSVIIVSFHTRYPSIQDSLYRANVIQNQARSDYYGISFTPQGILNGTTMDQFSAYSWSALLNVEMNTTRYLDISLSNSFNSATDSGTITANISLANALPSNQTVIHIVITENNVSYVTSPNGITSPNDVMRYMITGSDGEVINVGQSNSVTKSYGLNTNWKPNNCFLTVYVQDEFTGEVFGVERIKVTQ